MSYRSAELQRPTVLLANDDRPILATLSQGLRGAGFPTVAVTSGTEALRYCQESPPGIAVLDFNIPDVSGPEMARALSPVPFPVIFLSADGDDPAVRAVANLGVMAFLVKPVDPLQLVTTIHTMLRCFSDLTTLRGESAQLNVALQTTRSTSVVVGLLMERLCLSEKEAYDKLRAYCRSHNRRVAEVAAEILSATERLNVALSAIGEASARGKSPGT